MEVDSKTGATIIIMLLLIAAFVYDTRQRKKDKLNDEKIKIQKKRIKKVLSVNKIEQIDNSDGLSCRLKIWIQMPKLIMMDVSVNDAIELTAWEVKKIVGLKLIGNDNKMVIYQSPDLYLNRKFKIVVKVSDIYNVDPVTKFYSTKKRE